MVFAVAVLTMLLLGSVAMAADGGHEKKWFTGNDEKAKKAIQNGCVVDKKDEDITSLRCGNENVAKQAGLTPDVQTFALPVVKVSSENIRAADIYADILLNATPVWNIGVTGKGIPIAVLDTGVAEHPELKGRILKGRNFVDPKNPKNTFDGYGHGTWVTSIALGKGVNPYAKGISKGKVMPAKVLSDEGFGTFSDIPRAINWSVRNGARIIIMSIGSSAVYSDDCGADFPELTAAVANARKKGVLVFSAAGNEGAAGTSAPGCVPGIITIGSIGWDYTHSWFSGEGSSVDLVGFGEGIIGAVPTGTCPMCDPTGYAAYYGTSGSTPEIAGFVALMLDANSRLSVEQIETNLYRAAVDLGPEGKDILYGWGLPDAYKAVQLSKKKNMHMMNDRSDMDR